MIARELVWKFDDGVWFTDDDIYCVYQEGTRFVLYAADNELEKQFDTVAEAKRAAQRHADEQVARMLSDEALNAISNDESTNGDGSLRITLSDRSLVMDIQQERANG
jgi:hypothetical protein